MKRFLMSALIFISLQIITASTLLFVAEARFSYRANTSEAMIPHVPKNEHVPLVLLGSSHARVLTTGEAETITKSILQINYLNFGKTAAGIIPAKTYLQYFYAEGNSADTIVYILDPFVFFDTRWNEASMFTEDEPLDLLFAKSLVRSGVGEETISTYVRSKFTPYWVLYRTKSASNENNELTAVDKEAIAKRVSLLYPAGIVTTTFDRYTKEFEEIISLTKKHDSSLKIIIPPTLFSETPGLNMLKNYLATTKQHHGIDFKDFSGILQEPRYYQDHDHLNVAGLDNFLKNYFVPFVFYGK